MKTNTFFLCATLLLACGSTDLFAQIALKQTIPGAPTQNFTVQIDGKGFQDITGDGKPDIAFFKTDPQGQVSLAIVDAADYTVWRLIQLDGEVDIVIPNTNGLKAMVIGFFELDGSNGTKEIVLAQKQGRRFVNPIVIDVEGKVLWDGSSKTLIGIDHMDGDVCEEIVASDPSVPHIEVWGEVKG